MLDPPSSNGWPVVFARKLSDTGVEFPVRKVDTVEVEEIGVSREEMPTP